jgi:hypothetical protein
VVERVLDLLLEGLVAALQFGNVGFNGHLAGLL